MLTLTRTLTLTLTLTRITGWYPPSGEDVALWHVVHEDGDENDLEDWEVEGALARLGPG